MKLQAKNSECSIFFVVSSRGKCLSGDLGPSLFMLYINDPIDNLHSCHKLCAVEMKIFGQIAGQLVAY